MKTTSLNTCSNIAIWFSFIVFASLLCLSLPKAVYADEPVSQNTQGLDSSSQTALFEDEGILEVVEEEEKRDPKLSNTPNKDSSTGFKSISNDSSEEGISSETDEDNVDLNGGLGLEESESGIFYINEDGSILKNSWKTVGNNTYYFGADGFAVKGIQLINDNKYCFDSETSIQLFGWQSFEEKYFYFDPNSGAMIYGFQEIGGKYYYLDPSSGVRYSGWKDLNGDRYYFKTDTGECVTGWALINGEKYYFKSDTGVQLFGWQKIYGKYYLLDPKSGACYFGWKDLDGSRYYFDVETGECAIGWQRINDAYYYFKSDTAAMMTGLQKIYGKYYYLDPETGVRYTGWKDLDGKRYYFKSDTGARLTGWQKIYGKYYYFSSGGVMSKGSKKIYGITYHFDKNGACTNYYPVKDSMARKAQSYSSRTKYLILVNKSNHRVAVFKGSPNNWSLQHYWSCVTGAPSSPTITGSFYTTGFKRSSLSTDSRAIYCTQIWGGYFFHSILASENELGKSLSHGCIRLPYSAAKWIQNNIYSGTRVIIY